MGEDVGGVLSGGGEEEDFDDDPGVEISVFWTEGFSGNKLAEGMQQRRMEFGFKLLSFFWCFVE